MKKGRIRIIALLAALVVLIGMGLAEQNRKLRREDDNASHETTWEVMKLSSIKAQREALYSEQEDEQKQEALSLYAGAAALLDADSGRILYEKNGYEPMAMASTTKIMTCILALELGNPDEVVTFSANAAAQPDVQMNGNEGEQYYLKDLLYSLMLESHNDTAVAIAEQLGGTVEGFAELMNEKAAELGAFDTVFVTPNGLDAPGHHTTACDLAKIAEYAIQNPEFLEIVQTPAYTFSEINGKRSVAVVNKDRFLTSYEGAIGIKTGFTGEAGYCFVGAARREGKTLISVVLASGWPPHKSYKWEDTQKLMDYGMETYSYREIITSEQNLTPIEVLHGEETRQIEPEVRDTIGLLMREDEEVQVRENLLSSIEAPVNANTLLGTLDVYIDGEIFRCIPVYAGTTVKRLTYPYAFRKIIYRYFLL